MPKQFDSDAADKRGAEGWNMQGKQYYIILVDGLPEEKHPHCHPKGQQDKTRLDIAIYIYIYIIASWQPTSRTELRQALIIRPVVCIHAYVRC